MSSSINSELKAEEKPNLGENKLEQKDIKADKS